jgi:Cys-rich protein (TIGR01571 family)
MTRMRVDWTGDPDGYRSGGLSPFKVMVMVTICNYALYVFVNALTQSYTVTPSEYGAQPVIPGWVALLVGLRAIVGVCLALYVLIAMIRTRRYIRKKYAIPEQYCSGCDDCCLSFWCGCCTTSQMLRHTADYRAYNANCCSDTGLCQEARHVV